MRRLTRDLQYLCAIRPVGMAIIVCLCAAILGVCIITVMAMILA
ncbi:MAG: hypothetical protein AAB632_01975 [Patescibacteria group bacterium]